jgi:hypothetical protein
MWTRSGFAPVVGQVVNLQRVGNPLALVRAKGKRRRLTTGAQDTILPHRRGQAMNFKIGLLK